MKSLSLAFILSLGVANAELISHYTFDETSGTTAVDEGPAGADGVIGTNVTLGDPGVFGTAFTFHNDASQNGIVDMGNATGLFSAITASQKITISVWLKWTPSGDNRDSAIFLGDNTVASRYIDLGTAGNTNSGVYGRTRNNQASGFSDGIRGAGLNDGKWHHVAYTSDVSSGTAQLYIDGVPQAVQAGTNTFPTTFNNFEIGRLGRSAPTDAYAGSVDELRIYDSILSADEIRSLSLGDPSLQVAATVSFTNKGGEETLWIPFSNEGTGQTLVLTEPAPITVDGPDADYFTVASYDNNISPGASGEIGIHFNPVGSGFYHATLAIASNDSIAPSREVAITVEVTDPIAALAPAAIDFGSFDEVSEPQTRTLTITNEGGATDLTVYDLTFTGSPAFSTNATLPFQVTPGGSTDVTVTFDPAGSDGRFSANLLAITDGYNQSLFNIPLSAEVKLADPDASLVSHFTFDNEASPGEDTGSYSNHGTPLGDAQRTSSARVGSGALLLDGSGDLIDLGTETGADYTSQLIADNDGFTVACWAIVPVGATVDRTRFFSAYANGASSLAEGWGVGRRNVSAALVGTTYGKADYLAPANSAPAAGAWHHYAYVFRNVPVNRVDFYIDGALVDSRTAATTDFNNATTVGFAIGALGRSNAFEGFEGRMDDLRIYDRELMGSNIADIYNSAPSESAYDTWAASFGLDPAGNGAHMEDPDGDGLANAVEFVLGSSPVSGESANLPAAARSANNLVVVYRRETAATAAGFVDRVQHGDDLAEGNWTTAVDGVDGVVIDTVEVDDGIEEVTVSIPSPGDRKFARLMVAAPQ